MKVNLSLGKNEIWAEAFTRSSRFDRENKILDCNTVKCSSTGIECSRCLFEGGEGGSEYLLNILEEAGRIK